MCLEVAGRWVGEGVVGRFCVCVGDPRMLPHLVLNYCLSADCSESSKFLCFMNDCLFECRSQLSKYLCISNIIENTKRSKI